MAFPQVAAETNGLQTSNSNSWTLSYGTGASSGDVFIGLMGTDGDVGASPPFSVWPSGWVIIEERGANNNKTISAYKVSDGTETGDFSVSLDSTEQGGWRVLRLTGAHNSTPPEVNGSAGNNQNPDPPSLTPSWGAEDTLWIAMVSADHGDTTVDAFPTNYGNGTSQNSGGANGAALGVARRELNATSDNPGTFTLSVSEQWTTQILAIRPAPAGGTTFFQTVAATAVGSVSISDVITFVETIPATAVGVASLARVVSYFRTIPATATGVATVSTSATFYRTISATAVATASLVKTMFKTIAATAVGQASLQTASVIGQTISATAVGVASVTNQLILGVTIPATAVGQAALSAAATFYKSISSTAIGSAVVSTVLIPTQTFFQTISATAVGVVTLGAQFISGGAPAVVRLMRSVRRRRR